MLCFTKATAGAVFAGSLLLTAGMAPATAAPVQDGLINFAVRDVTIPEDANVIVAAQVGANISGVEVGPMAALGQVVDRSGATRTVCRTDQDQPVTLQQN